MGFKTEVTKIRIKFTDYKKKATKLDNYGNYTKVN